MYNDSDILIKIRMSGRDLELFKDYIENYSGDLAIGLKRKRNLALLLDENYSKIIHEHEVTFMSYSRIDGYPYLSFKKLPNDTMLKDLIKNGEVINFQFKDLDDVELELVKPMEDNFAPYTNKNYTHTSSQYKPKKPGKIKWFDNQNTYNLYE